MSAIHVELAKVVSLSPHPNADRLEVAEVSGATVVVQRGAFCVGSEVIYFPPGLLIPDRVSQRFGVAKYLKHAEYPGDCGHSQCRVAGARIRGVPSFGFVVDSNVLLEPDFFPIQSSLDEVFGAVKYEPRPRVNSGDAEVDHESFHRYTDIENFRNYRGEFSCITVPVVITEKIHGSNCRVGKIRGEYMAGSHKIRRKRSDSCMYWDPLRNDAVREMIDHYGDGCDVVVFGEIYGPGVQDMTYGVPQGSRGFRVFDISVNGKYLDFGDLVLICNAFGVETVPVLYCGDYEEGLVERHVDGKTTIGEHSGKFKGREGVVVRPAVETFSSKLGGRLILKAISADYLDRSGATDDE